ncbi:MAG: phosphoglycerate dehydrogenase [Ignavibacteriaceae bacterium]|nr:phosphoglycerate dehydrogenase [Ignavibacteriaceae bacterium]
MKKILISDSIDEKCTAILKSAGFEVHSKTEYTREELLTTISDFNALVVRSSTQVDAELIEKMDKMEVIGRAGAGVDSIDVKAATRKGILVMNTPGGNTISAAEHTIALILAASRKIPQANISLHLKKWDRKRFQGTELFGKTLGLIGLGKIGKEVAIRAKAFGMNIISYDPLVSAEAISEFGIQLVQLEDIWKNADIISVHTPLNDRTKNLISYNELSKCKTGVVIINCARGGIINESDLLLALKEGKVSAAGLDVFETEPPDFGIGLIQHPAVVSTPHLGASTEEAQQKVAVQIAEQIVEYFKNGSPTGAVNASVLKEISNENLKAFLRLAEVQGKILSQIRKDSLLKLSISLSGELLTGSTKLLTAALLKGFLSEELDLPVNYINARLLAEEMGIIVEEIVSTNHRDYLNLIEAKIITTLGEWKLSGTVFGSNELRIVEINNYPVEFKPEGNILIYKNVDRPGMLASVSRELASSKINIAGLSLGRKSEGDDALTIINIDSPIDQKIKSSISSLDGVKEIYSVYI